VGQAGDATDLLRKGLAHRILKEERDIAVLSRPLEASAFQVENIRMAYVFYESKLSINVMYTLDGTNKRAVGFKLSEGDGNTGGARLTVQVRETEIEACRNHSRFHVPTEARVLTRLGCVGRNVVAQNRSG